MFILCTGFKKIIIILSIIFQNIVGLFPFVCRDWKFKHPARKMFSMRTVKVGKIALFSREMMYTILITNVLSLIIGTGMG